MANVTRIKAKDPNKKSPKPKDEPVVPATTAKKSVKATKKSTKTTNKTKKPMSKPVAVLTWPFRMIAKPFIALGRYIKASWHEIRQVRWPSRGATWKMVLAIFIYSAIFLAFILLLDALFTFIFNNILGS